MECVYMSTFGLSFVGRFVLFRSVLYRRFHCSENLSYRYNNHSCGNSWLHVLKIMFCMFSV